MGILDLINGYGADSLAWLDNKRVLNSDLVALRSSLAQWERGEVIDVGESGTLYRYLLFTSWKQKKNARFKLSGTLKSRSITVDPSIIDYSQEELLLLDNKTSQWASAAALNGDRNRVKDPPFKLATTYQAINHWYEQREQGLMWSARRDDTIKAQAEAFNKLLHGKLVGFTPKQAEDYCFARMLNQMSPAEGEKIWPALRGHESDRILEMEKSLDQAALGHAVTSNDHRVVQALAMWGLINNKPVQFTNRDAVSKSWPEFWSFIEWSKLSARP